MNAPVPAELEGTPGLTILFPAWNEAEGIARTVAAAIATADRLVLDDVVDDYEIVVVDDASTDDTAAIVEKLALDHPRVRLVRHPVNRKLGGALRTGFDAARGDVVLYTDADLPFDLDEVGRAFWLMRHRDVDVVSLYREDRRGEGVRRLLYSYVYNSLVDVVLGVRIRDVNFAGKLIRRRVLDQIDLRSEGSFIDVELLAKAQRSGFSVMQFGVHYFPRTRGTSTLSSPSVILRILSEALVIVPEIRALGPRPSSR